MVKQAIDSLNERDIIRGDVRLRFRMALGLLGTAALLYTGCSMCCGPFDYHYPVFGGAVQRTDPVHGRVGSIYSDPGPFGGPPADSNLAPQESEAKTDDLESLQLDDDSDLEMPEELFNEKPDDTDVLPPPDLQRPGPDEDTNSVRRLRTQSWQRGYRQQWR